MRYLLFSECLQNDFVAPMNAGAPLPNELHIGRAESRRLLGDPEGAWTEEGPLARFLSAFLTGAGRDHASVHIRDWHDPEDPATRAHLEQFGSHCVRGTRGAEFVFPLAPILNAGENLLGANAPRLADYVDLETRGAIKYQFATMQAGEARTLQRAFREVESAAAARTLFDRLIERVLHHLYQSPVLDRLDLFTYYNYRPSYAEATLELLREAGLTGACPHGSTGSRSCAIAPTP